MGANPSAGCCSGNDCMIMWANILHLSKIIQIIQKFSTNPQACSWRISTCIFYCRILKLQNHSWYHPWNFPWRSLHCCSRWYRLHYRFHCWLVLRNFRFHHLEGKIFCIDPTSLRNKNRLHRQFHRCRCIFRNHRKDHLVFYPETYRHLQRWLLSAQKKKIWKSKCQARILDLCKFLHLIACPCRKFLHSCRHFSIDAYRCLLKGHYWSFLVICENIWQKYCHQWTPYTLQMLPLILFFHLSWRIPQIDELTLLEHFSMKLIHWQTFRLWTHLHR